jgi:hypothetical protein
MIRYALVCDKRHEFDSWFANSDAYDSQAKRGFVTCPVCGTAKVEKALMRPRLGRSDRSTSTEAGETGSPPAEVPAAPATKDGAHPAPATPPAAVAPAAPVAMMSPQEQEFRRKLRELRDHLVANAENVGPRFPEEARKMHYGEVEHRSIYGIASPDDAKQLHEEGIVFSPLPILPDDRN